VQHVKPADSPAHTDKPAAAAVAQLDEQAKSLRAELTLLRRELDTARQEAVDTPSATLRDANEQLVLAALESDALADTATFKLDELTRSSQRDALTDTPNRALMLDRLENAIAMGRRHRTHVAVIFLDLDHFKAINDTLGHAVGDEVLKLVARRLESVVRASDTVSRHSGDEFLMLLTDVSHRSAVAAIAAKVLAAVLEPALVGQSEIGLSASVGIAMFPEDGDDPATLIALADKAMYRAKDLRGTFAFHSGGAEADAALAPPAIDAQQTRATGSEVTLTGQQPGVLQLREANENLVIAALTAQALEATAIDAQRRQAQLLAIVAHELRNPLAPIRAAADLLKYAGTDAELLKEVQAIINRQVNHISKLVSDLLDGSRVSTGKFRLERRTTELADILGWAVQTCQHAVDRRRQRLTLRLPPQQPLLLDGDPMYLVQIFSNLLDNASKYTPDNGDISISAVALDHSLAITVADNGIGIASETLPKIFELYAQGVRASAHNATGLGVGLAVVRDLVHAHGGTVVGRSAGANLGSEFVVTFPCAKREGGAPADIRGPTPDCTTEKTMG
jgi:diguanylate cyclase